MGLRAGTQWRHAVRAPRIRYFVARLAGLLGCMAAISAAIAPGAGAANRIYWANYNINGLAYWSLDDSGGANINTLGATVDGPMGMALDPAHGRIYWTNWGSDSVSGTGLGTTISYANLDGSGGGGTLPITAGFVNGPHGLAIDPVAGKLYWPNFGSDTISYANLDGTGAANLNTTGAMVDGPRGVTVDPAAGKIYWANYADGFGTTISWANLDGTGGGDYTIASATVEGPEGIALDPNSGKIWWGNYGSEGHGTTIARADLADGANAADLVTPDVSPERVHGVALDPAANKVFWPNYGANTLSWANTDGSAAGEIPVIHSQAKVVGPVLPTLLHQPLGIGVPAVSGETGIGSSLSCTQGSWAPDLVTALLYRAPQSLSYQWTLDGDDIAGKTSETTIASAPGDYRCVVTAHNAAGGTSQTSDPHTIVPDVPPNDFTLGELKRNKHNGTAKLAVTVPASGNLHLEQGKKVKLVDENVAAGTTRLAVEPRGRTAQVLLHKGSVDLDPVVTFTPDGGTPNSQHRPLKLVEKPRS